ncbi:peptidoglycan-associated lipoprotein Pal [Marinomonas agarivorans]|nr:peptidoglycan-associated lipoprotein Pal [Marinomonas agarivorans]
MSVNKLGKFAVIGLSAAFIVGCGSTASDTDSSTVTETEVESSTDSSSGADNGGNLSSVVVEESNNTDSTATKAMLDGVDHIFYFDFDKSTVRPESREALATHAKYLVANPSATVVLEGHADERGTREYNMALGERRAKAISRYLTIQGVAAAQIETVSFGEEKPANTAHTDTAWQENRRVEVRYE